MALKKIKISGFKSFAEATSIAFCEGINAIVGPNGCGKSNIVDAFLWALGQQSPKQLRASSMQDVIFAGSLRRKAQNMAEVCVELSNENGLLPIEYQEVAITRRLYRDGESEYLLNKQSVRLKDIVELLAHTGVGKEAFAVIGQGKVAEIISQSPQDRLSLFEEVAGISHFLMKRKESERKLELAKGNVARAKDIVQEVDGRKKILEKQAHEAKQYQELRHKLACYERLVIIRRFDELTESARTLSEQAKVSSEKLSASFESEAKQKQALLEKKEAHYTCQKVKSELYDQTHDLEKRIQAIKKDIEFCDEKKARLSSQEKESESQAKVLEERMKTLSGQKETLEKELNVKRSELERLQEQKDRAFGEWQKETTVKDTLENSLKGFFSKRFSLQSRLQALESELKKSQLAEEVAKEKINERLVQKENLETQKRGQALELGERKKDLTHALSTVEQLKEALDAKTDELKEINGTLEAERPNHKRVCEQLYEKSAKVKALINLANQMEGYTSSTKVLLKEAKKPDSPLFGKIIPLAESVIFEHALLSRLYDTSLLCSTKQDLANALTAAETLKAQEVSFVCLELLGLSDPKDLQRHFLQKITPDIWLESKYYVDSFGVLHVAKARAENIFSRTKDIKVLEAEVETITQAQGVLEEKINTLDAQKQRIASDVQKKDQEMRKADMQVVSSNFQVQAHEKKLLEIDRDLARLDHEIARFCELSGTLKGQGVDKEDEHKKAQEVLKVLEEESKACEQEAKKNHAHISQLSVNKQKTLACFEDCQKLYEKSTHSLDIALVQIKELSSRLDQEKKLQKTCQQESLALDEKKKEISQDLERKRQEQASLKQKLDSEQAQGKGFEKEIKELELAIEALQAKKEELIKTHSQTQTELEHVQQELLTYNAAQALPAPEGLATFAEDSPTEEDIMRLKNRVERMRNVNLLAVEEYEESCQRYDLLISQLQDLEQAESELFQIISDLEKQSYKVFTKTFEEVRLAFQKHFQTLFQGGEADLVLCGEESGVEILAKPPGKQMRSMQLLSGGEKSLTALALLFGCFDVRPSPFCILDEVDAPLDETNVERLGNLLKHFCDKTQFLVITHNKKTMQIADTLIGVSMAEKGVSQIISLDFRRRESPVLVQGG